MCYHNNNNDRQQKHVRWAPTSSEFICGHIMTRILCLLLVIIIHGVDAFHVTRTSEIGLCTITDKAGHPHKFSCLHGDRNYCCGYHNQTCCTIDEFSSQHKNTLTLITIFLVLVILLFLCIMIVSLATVIISFNVGKRKKYN